MATTTANVEVNVRGLAGLEKLQQTVKKTQDSFGGLKTAIGGLALGGAIRSALQYADSISDVSSATGIAVAGVIGFGKAVTASGGNVEKANNALIKFTLSMGDAVSGSLAAQDAFGQVGVTLDDLRNLSEQDIFAKTLEGLGKIDDLSTRAKLANDLLGKAIKGVNISQVAADYNKSVAAAQKYAHSVEKAAAVQDKLEAAVSQFKLSLLVALGPITDFISKLDSDKIDKFITALVNIGGAAVAIVGLTKAFEGMAKVIALVGGYFALFGRGATLVVAGAGTAGAALASLGKTAGITFNVLKNYAIPAWIASGSFSKLVAEIGLTFATLGKRIGFATAAFGGLGGAVATIVGGLARMAGAIAIVTTGIILINDLIDLAFDVNPIKSMGDALENLVTKYMPGVASFINSIGSALGMSESKLQKSSQIGPPKPLQEDQEKREKAERAVNDALDKQRKLIQQISVDYAAMLGNKTEQLRLELSLIGATEDQREQATLLYELDQKRVEEIDKIRKAIAALSDEQKRGGMAEEYEKQIVAVENLTAAEKVRITTTLEGLTAARQGERLRLFAIDQETAALSKLNDLNYELATGGMSAVQKGYSDIVYQQQKSAAEAIRAEEVRRGAVMDEAEKLKYMEAATKRGGQLVDIQRKITEQSRSFSAGWNKAWNEYVDNATNASKSAENIFNKAMQGMEDLIVNFVKTGKFEWKDFVNSMLEELLRSQIQQAFGQILGGLDGLFGIGGGGAKGSTANNPMYVLDVAGGGGGGGLINQALGGGKQGGAGGGGILGTIGSGIKSVVGGIGDFFGGSQQPGTGFGDEPSPGIFSSIGSGISDAVSGIGDFFGGGGGGGGGSFLGGIGDSIGDFFGGFFANGGTLGAGKFGIAGERGPEIISGPAGITPMGGSTNVTYNISAVDAASFQALLARDPSFIYALTEQGRRGYAGGR